MKWLVALIQQERDKGKSHSRPAYSWLIKIVDITIKLSDIIPQMPEISANGNSGAAVTPRLRAPKLAYRVVADISERIRVGQLVAGSKLPGEFEIMREFGVSRAVVREAISKLQAAGLVESRQGSGTFVLEPPKGANFRIDPATVITMRDVLALLELRISLETEAASLAASRRSEQQLQALGACLEQIDAKLVAHELTTQLDFQFHLAIAEATGNRYFGDILNHLGPAILPRARVDLRFIAGDRALEYLSQSNREHWDIYQAIRRRDGDGARAAMRLHLGNSRARLERLAETAEPTPSAGA